MKLLITLFLTLQVVYCAIDKGRGCGFKILKVERCIQKNLTPSTKALKKALNICFNKNGCKAPRLEWDNEVDGNAVVDCLNKALTTKAHPLVTKCMRSKQFGSWQHAPVPETPPRDSPQAKIQLAVEQAQNTDFCPKSKADSVGRCINVAVQKTLPEPKKEGEIKKDYCVTKRKCEKALKMTSSCKTSLGVREVAQCQCANAELDSKYQKSADSVVNRCLVDYSSKSEASKIMKQIISQRPKDGAKPPCKASTDICA